MKQTNTEYKNQFAKDNYDRTIVNTKKGIKQKWEKIAKSEKLSLNAFVCKAVEKYIETLENQETAKSKDEE